MCIHQYTPSVSSLLTNCCRISYALRSHVYKEASRLEAQKTDDAASSGYGYFRLPKGETCNLFLSEGGCPRFYHESSNINMTS